jgi:ABC-type transport system substrate-binding protein
MLDQPYPRGNPCNLESHSLEYDPDKAKTLLKQARAVGTPLKIVCNVNTAACRECGQIVQEQWNRIGFRVTLEPLDTVPFLNARKQGEFDGLINGNTFRFDPNDFFGRNFHSQSEYTRVLSGWKNERYDQLVEEAKRTLNPARRKALYTEAWSIVNAELPHFHLHEVTQTSAAVKALQGYQPNVVGALTYRSGGLRTAYVGA